MGPSLVCNNCVGGVIYNELNERFNSPFVNLWINAPDFFKLIKSFDYYMKFELKFNSKKTKLMGYPVGDLGGILIYFQHYNTYDEAKLIWDKRKARLNYNDLRFLFVCKKSDKFNFLLFLRVIYKFSNISNFLFLGEFYNFKLPYNFIRLNYFKNHDVGDLIAEGNLWNKYFDVKSWFYSQRILKFENSSN